MRFFAIGLFGLLVACGGEDPVLKAAREAAIGETERSESPAQLAPTGGGHPIDGGLAMQPDATGTPGPGGVLTPGVPEEPPPGDPSSPSPGVPGTPSPGVPGDPNPGVPGAPNPGVPGQPTPGSPSEATDEGPVVTLKGTVEMSDYKSGEIRIDVFDGDHRSHAGQRPNLVRSTLLTKPGPFEILVPVSSGRVWLESSNDENQDGRPGPRDPSGRYERNPLDLSEEGASGIVIVLERHDPPPGGGGAEL